eukprot:TRINITY_DN402_c0_g1_i1.p1 TRINITY_DN402_c0_g1~~TRINITY_DN402_c0_g1_i1.p1  ORF type:complete len:84 (+),score=20.96 TRINITY_DN402_c0_g1_i1:28-252(+)
MDIDQSKNFKFVIVGDSSTGKTSIIRRFLNPNDFDLKQESTIGMDIQTKRIERRDHNIRLTLYINYFFLMFSNS